MPDITKLPRWAQAHITDLNDRLARAKSDTQTALDTLNVTDPGPVSLRDYLNPDRPVQGNPHVVFDLGDGFTVDVSRTGDGELVMHWYGPGRTLASAPNSGNQVTLKVIPR